MKRPIPCIAIALSILVSGSCSNTEKRHNDKTDTLDSPDRFTETAIVLETPDAAIHGTLNSSKLDEQTPLVLIIAGSGPTDRNGNNTSGLQTDTYKMISDTLASHGIASLRYDKRGVAESFYASFREEELMFDNYVDDAVLWVEKMQHDGWFSEIFLLGHSEGSLIGMLAAQRAAVSGYISVAGPAQTADALILEQLAGLQQDLVDEAASTIASLKQGIMVPVVSQQLHALFRPSVQPYLMSWFAYDPAAEISKLNVPLLVVHGTTDLQVNSKAAEQLAGANAKAQLALVEFMNHVLKDAGTDMQANLATYSNPSLPLNDEFCKVLTNFIEENREQP